MTIKKIREKSGLSRAAFSRQYGIPVRTLENWESGTNQCPDYVAKLLERAVAEDIKDFKCYTPEILKEIGNCYQKLLYVLNPNGNNPYPEAQTFPTKYFTMVYVKAVNINIPDGLHRQISQLMQFVDPDDWAESMSRPCPIDIQWSFLIGMQLAHKCKK